MASSLKVVTVAMDVAWKDVEANIQATRQHVETIKQRYPDTQVILFPEMCLTGYILDESNKDFAQPLSGPSVQAVAEIAKANNVTIISSMIGEGKEKPRNTTFVVSEEGELIAHYSKMHLFTQTREPELYAPGEELSVFELHGWRCGLSTCFDIRYPRLYETYKQQGVECSFVQFNWVKGRNKPELFHSLMKARATETQSFFVGVDRSGEDPNTSYHGISSISNPFGEEQGNKDGVYSYAELDKKEIGALSRLLPLDCTRRTEYTVKSFS